jgi:hypothetical protein
MGQKRWVGSSFARLEQRIMLGFYGVRKLRDSHKISDHLRHRFVPLAEFDPTGKAIDLWSRTEIDEIYEMGTPRETKKPLEFVCNQIIHSYIFTPGFNERRFLEDLFFASDKQKDRGMFCIKIDQIVSIFEDVGNNDPSYFFMTRGQSGGREVIDIKVD